MPSFEKEGEVSVWVGFERRDPSIDLLKDLCGVEHYDVDSQECIVDGKNWMKQPIKRLLGRLSYSGSFLAEALAAARERGLIEALYVVAQYDFAYDPKKAKKRIAADPVFLGHFAWSDQEDE